jgi:fatty acid desaturase
MKPAVWFCAAVATALAAAILYGYGISLFSVLVALILLACPVWVIWMSLRLSRQTRREVEAAVERELKSRRKS